MKISLKKNALSIQIAFFVAILLIAHLILFAYYFDFHHENHKKIHSNVAQEVVNIIRVATFSPKRTIKPAIDAIKNPYLNVDLTDNPKFSPRYYGSNFTENIDLQKIRGDLTKYAAQEPQFITMSYLLDNGEWLNVKATLHPQIVTIRWILLAFEIINFLVILTYLLIIQHFRRPLLRLKTVAEKISIDSEPTMLPVAGPQIVQDLIISINKMQQRISNLLDQRKLTLAAMSHDLRTPITRLKLKADLIEDENKRSKFINDLNEIEEMINDTIMLTKQNYLAGQRMSMLDIVSLVKSICDDATDMEKPVNFSSSEQHQRIIGNPVTLKRAITNIINNSIKYGKTAHVNIRNKEQNVIITIEDEGPGLPEQELEKIFDPFYRLEPSRSKMTGGTGLGLAIAKSIVSNHNGTIEVANRDHGGLKIDIILPLS
ncbi:MAG: ATP-binding protein [Gammaproteobacteria bacterium]|nr:ATP-binding protein [Gammaproteobacteria bacterium]